MLSIDKEALVLTNKTAFLIGNGCSMSCGFPSGQDLLLYAFKFIQEHYNNNTSSILVKNLANTVYNQLENFFRNISDFREMVAWGNLDFLHFPYYYKDFLIATAPEICKDKQCQYNCYSKTYRNNPFFKESIYKNIKCKELQDFLKDVYIWALFKELTDKYYDNKLYGSIDIKQKKQRIEHFTLNLSNMITTVLFYCYTNAKNTNIYDLFVNKVGKENLIINLNYDLLIEDADKNKKLKIIKPHGSLDFAYFKGEPYKHWKVEKIECNSYKFPKETINDFYQVKFLPNIEHLCVPYAEMRSIITFEKQRSILEDYVKNNIEKIKKELEQVDTIITIGYSFSENITKTGLIDEHIINLIKDKRIYVISKKEKDSQSIINNVKKHYPSIKIYPTSFNGFEDYVNKLY